MEKIVSVEEAAALVKNLKNQGKKIVLAGGCFDVLHPGHIMFLEKAKAAGEILIILLESDEKVKELKGVNRPVQTQKIRAKALSALETVDYVVILPFLRSETAYDKVIQKIRPDIIALTVGYERAHHHKRAANLTGAQLKYVTERINSYSTSQLLSD